MTGRLTRIAQRVGIDMLLARGRKPRIVPMSAGEERDLAELHRRRELARRMREGRP